MDSEALVHLAAEAADDRKAVDIRLLKVDDVTTLTDWFLVCSGLSTVQVKAIARSVKTAWKSRDSCLCARRVLVRGVGCFWITAM